MLLFNQEIYFSISLFQKRYQLSKILFADDINEFLYPAELAGMNYSMSNTKYGVNIGVGGYHDKQKILLAKIFSRLTEYKVDEDRFRILKEAYIRGLKNFINMLINRIIKLKLTSFIKSHYADSRDTLC